MRSMCSMSGGVIFLHWGKIPTETHKTRRGLPPRAACDRAWQYTRFHAQTAEFLSPICLPQLFSQVPQLLLCCPETSAQNGHCRLSMGYRGRVIKQGWLTDIGRWQSTHYCWWQTLSRGTGSHRMAKFNFQAGMIGFITLQQSAPSQMTWQDSNTSRKH